MVGLPHANRAIVDLRKLEGYCLDPTHPRGRHKARVFHEALGIGKADAAWLRDVFLDAARGGDALQLHTDEFGSRWTLDVLVTRQARAAVVRTIWIERTAEDVVRFVTCWVL